MPWLFSMVAIGVSLFFCGLLYPLPVSAQQPDARTSARFTTVGGRATEIPFTLQNNRIYVQVRVNDSPPLRFALDTGATVCALDREQAKASGLKPSGTIKVSTMGGIVNLPIFRGASLRLPGFEMTIPTLVGVDLKRVETGPEERVDGILGADFFRDAVVEINYQTGTIRRHNRATYRYNGPGESLPLTIGRQQVPSVRARIVPSGGKAIEGRFLIDTGSAYSLAFPTPFVQKHRLIASCPETVPLIREEIGGRSTSRVGRLQQFALGRFVLESPVAFFSQDTQGSLARTDHDGSIGGWLLRRFTLILDYRGKRMILEPNASLAEPFPYHYSGFHLSLDGPTLKGNRVQRVDADSPAAAAGLREDDVLVTIDGRPAAEMTLTELNRVLQQETPEGRPREHALGVRRRDGGLQTLTYKVRKL